MYSHTKGQPERHGNSEVLHTKLDTPFLLIVFQALSNDNQIAGVALNGVLREGDVERATEALKHSNDDRFKKIFNLLYEQNIKANLFEELGVTKLFEIRILSVDKK